MKTIRKTQFLHAAALAGVICAGISIPAMAMTRHIDLEADLDDVPEYSEGEAFLPNYVLTDDNDDEISIDLGEGPETTANPTIPCSLRITIHSDSGSLDEDLVIALIPFICKE